MKNVPPLIVLVLLLTVGCSHQAITGKATTQNQQVIKIGFVGPLSGNAAVFGEVEKNAIDIALSEINSEGGINGKLLEVIYEDGKCTPKDAVIAAQKLIGIDKVKIILSDCSAETLAIAPITEKNKVILITAWGGAPEITTAGDYVFRLAVSDAKTARLAAETILIKSHKNVGTIYELSSYSVGLNDAFQNNFKSEGGIVFSESFEENTKDVKSQIVKVLSKKPEVLFLNPNTPVAALMLLKELKELGFSGQLYCNLVCGSEQVAALPEAQGMILFTDPDIDNNLVKQHFLQKYIEVYGQPPLFEYPALSRYDNIYLLKQAIETVGENPDKIKDYFYSMDSFTGALGMLNFDKNGDMIGVLPSVKQIENEQIVNYIDN